jgi:DNA topoisomerase I
MSDEKLQAYCVKCKTKRDMQEMQTVYTKTGAPGTRGKCAECGTNLFRMGETPAHANVPKPENIEKPVRKKKPKKKTAKSRKSKKAKKKQPKKNIGKLVIVESPAKARSIGGFLGKGYTVMSSKGHVRDLLKTTLSVDVENEFEPRYRVPNDKRDVVKELKAAALYADEIFLATDPDREGEAIAWHLVAAAEMPEDNIKRVVFHEITDTAVAEAFSHPREIDMDLVNAQQARRILDRLVGYNITELLWDRVRNRLSAGRVQSIALRVVVEREKEIEAFVPVEYWSIDALLGKKKIKGIKGEFIARLAKINGEDPVLDSEEIVNPHVEILNKSLFIVKSVKRGTRQRRPSAPFTTSTLQQEASRRLNFNARRTMQNAQQLYEGIDIGQGKSVGLITYMRTDSVQVSEQAQANARKYVHDTFGKEYTPAKPPKYKTKSKSAQEAHEAVRPTDVTRTPAMMKDYLKRDQLRMYKLIWERFVASQMSNAVYDTLRVELNAGLTEDDTPYLFRASGSKIKFYGFLALYEDSKDEDSTEDTDEGLIFPELDDKEKLDLRKLMPEQHFTQPPPRYTEASLVRTLEEYGIGRPSTYAPTVTVIQSRDYVTKEDKRLVPTDTGKVVSDLLAEYFTEEMNYTFTAKMEDQLDGVSEGKMDWRPMLGEFYTPFEKRLTNARENMPKLVQEEFVGRTCPTCETGDLVIKYGRWGKFIGCSNYPECRHTEQHLERTGHVCPTCGDEHGGDIVQRRTRKGRTFYGCSRYPDCDFSQWKLPKDLKKIDENPVEAEPKERSIG